MADDSLHIIGNFIPGVDRQDAAFSERGLKNLFLFLQELRSSVGSIALSMPKPLQQQFIGTVHPEEG